MKAANILDLHHKDPQWEEVTEEEEEADADIFDKKNAHVKAFRSEDKNLVPIGKFCSNDGWHIVPEECLIIADGIDKLIESKQLITYIDGWDNSTHTIDPTSEDMPYIKEFSEYCRKASKADGFVVW
jgi:hypothetical protein